MIIAESYGTNGQSGHLGYGFGGLTKGTDFNCTSEACYGIGKVHHELFKDLQTQINKVASANNIPLIPVDGFIGDKTKKALEAISVAIGLSAEKVASYSAIAENAAAIVSVLSSTASSQGWEEVAPPKPTATDKAAASRTSSAKADDEKQRGMSTTSPIWWILAGVAVVGVSTVGYLTYQRRKGSPRKPRRRR